MNLSPHFTRAELDRYGEAGPADLDALRRLAVDVLEPIRARWGPLRITSGYRSPGRNAQTPGASTTSQHTRGEAADFVPVQPVELGDVWTWIAASGLPIGQVILEQRGAVRWIHVSTATDRLRGQVLRSPSSGVYVRVV